MKLKILLLLFVIALLTGSSPDDLVSDSKYFPVLMKREDLEKSIMFLNPREIVNPGKIYYKDQTVYLNEKYKGIHIIDNRDPRNPQNIGFINIPGCVDIAIKNNNLLADNAIDLVSIDISVPSQVSVSARIKNAFPESTPPDLEYIPYVFNIVNRPANTIIVGWEKIER